MRKMHGKALALLLAGAMMAGQFPQYALAKTESAYGTVSVGEDQESEQKFIEKTEMEFDSEGMAKPIINFTAIADEYTNENSTILRFPVYVETDYDTDLDGYNDMVMAVVQVPRIAAEGHYKAPTIFEASPYFGGTSELYTMDALENSVSKIFQYQKQEDFKEENLYFSGTKKRAQSTRSTNTLEWAKDQDSTKTWHYKYQINGNETSYFQTGVDFYDYFLVRGFAVVTSAGIGTKGSEGLETCGSQAEVSAFKNIIEWIHGDRAAYTDKSGKVKIAADWANGNVGMNGASYNGTMAYEVATTGVDGLKTVVPECAISSWYEYTNQQGASIYADYNYTDDLASHCASRFFGENGAVNDGPDGTLDLYNGFLYDVIDRQRKLNGSWGDYWNKRDFSEVKTIKVPGLIVMGLQDWNVRPMQAYRMKNAFTASGQEVRMLFHLDGHTTPENMVIDTKKAERNYRDILNLWFTNFLVEGADTGILDELAPVTAQNNLDQTFVSMDKWDSDDYLTVSSNRTDEQKITKTSQNSRPASPAVPMASDQTLRTTENMYYNIDSFYDSLPEGTLKPASTEETAYNATWVQNIYTDTTINGIPVVTARIKAEDVSEDQMVFGAMLYDVCEESFDACVKENDGTDLNRTVLDSYYFQKDYEKDFMAQNSNKDLYQVSQEKYTTSSCTKVMITKGFMSLKCYDPAPNAGYNALDLQGAVKNSINKDTYYDYTLYLHPTVYTVKAGHKLVLYLIPELDNIKSTTSFTIDNKNSLAQIPVILPEGVKSADELTRIDKELDVNSEYSDDDTTRVIKEQVEGEAVSTATYDNDSGKSAKDSSIWVNGLSEAYVWQGKAITLENEIKVYDGTKLLTLGKDYKLTYKNNKKANDNASVTVKFTGEYKGNKAQSFSFAIQKAGLPTASENILTDEETYVSYTGKNQKPLPVMTYNYTGVDVPKNQVTVTYMKEGTTEELSAVNEAGEYVMIVRPKNEKCSVEGETEVSLIVESTEGDGAYHPLSDAKITLSSNRFVYAHAPITPEVTVTIPGVNNGNALDPDSYTVSYVNQSNIWPGTAKMVISAVDDNEYNICGSKTATFKITKGRKLTDEEGSDFSFYVSNGIYSKKGGKPNTVIVKDGDDVLTLGTDYTLSYSKNKKAAQDAVVTIKGKGNYKGSVKYSYYIYEASISDLYCTAADKFGDTDNGYM
nr:hypothetical protein [Lachnospiraceae bacterium]